MTSTNGGSWWASWRSSSLYLIALAVSILASRTT